MFFSAILRCYDESSLKGGGQFGQGHKGYLFMTDVSSIQILIMVIEI